MERDISEIRKQLNNLIHAYNFPHSDDDTRQMFFATANKMREALNAINNRIIDTLSTQPQDVAVDK